MDDITLSWFIVGISSFLVVFLTSGYAWLSIKKRKHFWHHGVRLPSQPSRTHWYVITLSVGCRPWAGHEGDVYVKLIGSEGETNTFLINGEVHSRLNEAETHMHLHATQWPLGNIEYVIVVCAATMRKKRWFLSSVKVQYVTDDAHRINNWYFPYHEWIEVFMEPVKVTLSGVHPNSDINRRILLGWLSRCFTDYHLWTSTFFSRKYSNFPRSLRFLCSTCHVTTSISVIILINWCFPHLGAVVLAVYTSAIASLPVYGGEFCFRKAGKSPQCVAEDVGWYHGRLSWKPKDMQPYSALPCQITERAEIERYKDYRKYRSLLDDETEFWNWMAAGADHVSAWVAQESDSFFTAPDGVNSIVTKQPGFAQFRPKGPGKFRRTAKKVGHSMALMKRRLSRMGPLRSKVGLDDSANFDFPSMESLIQATTNKDTNLLELNIHDVINAVTHVNVGKEGFFVNPTSVWKVDSSFSIDSLNMGGLDFKYFTAMESMPVSEFDKLRQGRRALLPSRVQNQQINYSGGAIEELTNRKILKRVFPINKPKSLEGLSREEIELVGMIYFDLATEGQQWTKHDVPDDAYTTSHEDNPLVFESMLKQYPEPIPKQRIFSMMLFPEYAEKLTQAYRDMTSEREMFTSVGELFSILGECERGVELFVRFGIVVSSTPTGRKAFRDVMSLVRNTRDWELLLCDVTRRLKYQADNVIRIQEKYGEFDSDRVNLVDSDLRKNIEAELLKIRHWCDKISDLEIPSRDCPLAPMHKRDFKRMSRFYRFMLTSQDGAVLFGEILLQIASSGGEGLDVIRRILNYVASREEGVSRLIELHGEVGLCGREGLLLLLRLYREVKGQSMCGSKVLSRLAEHASKVRTGKMLIADLQVDGRKGHTVAREIRSSIDNHLEPLVKRCSRNIAHVINHLNTMAGFILEAVDHARVVVEDHYDDIELIIPDMTKRKQSLEKFDESKPPWKSCNVCCEMREKDETNAASPPSEKRSEKSEEFRWTPNESDISCEVHDHQSGDFEQPIKTLEEIIDIKSDERKPVYTGVLCQANLKRNRNEFYLQSNDYEKFYLNFDYKPRRKTETQPRKPTLDEIANRWGRDVNHLPKDDVIPTDDVTQDDDAISTLPIAQEHSDGCRGCMICSLADQLNHVTNSRDLIDVMTDHLTKVPQVSAGADESTVALGSSGIPFPSAGCSSGRDTGVVFRYEVKQHDHHDEHWPPGDAPSDRYSEEFEIREEDNESEEFQTATEDELLRHNKKPITAKKMFKENWLKELCDLRKLPQFECCSKLKKRVPHECVCKQPEPPEQIVNTSSLPPKRRVCENCKVCIGTQQRPPCPRYLHPLKAFTCYQQAKQTVVASDSGISLYTAYDVISSDVKPIKTEEQQVLMELIGISEQKSLLTDDESKAPSSDACCHVKAARQVPLLHLQGYSCDTSTLLHYDITNCKPLDADWWRRHDVALLGVQRCVDECVRSRGLVARTVDEAVGDHEKSCSVCGGSDVFISPLVTRYSGMLPVAWRPTIREFGDKLKNADKDGNRMRFYRHLIQCAVQSTRTILIAPDLRSKQSDETEPIVTSYHATKLAHFREMMKSFNKVLEDVLSVKRDFPSKYHDITQEFDTASDVMADFRKSGKTSMDETVFDTMTKFLETKLCGSVSDCTEALEAPWELPVREQQIAGKFLNKLIGTLQSEPGRELPLDGVLEFCLKECLREIVENATNNTCVMRAIDNSNLAKQHLSNINVITGLSVRRLMRLSEVVDSSLRNTRELMRRCLEDVDGGKVDDEDWWKQVEGKSTSSVHDHISSILHTGHDVSNCTIDDVLIEFERIRQWIRFDMKLSNQECDKIIDLRDDLAYDITKRARRLDQINCATSYDVWTESESALRDDVICEPEQNDDVTIFGEGSVSSSTSHVDITSSDDEAIIPLFSMGSRDVKPDAVSTDRASYVTCASEFGKTTKHVTFRLDEPPAPSCGAKEEFVKDLKETNMQETEVTTKEALKTQTGKKMLKEIFGSNLTPKQMTDAYQSNIDTLLKLFPSSNSRYSHIASIIAHSLLHMCCACSLAFSCFYAFTFIGPSDHVIIKALPIAILVFGLIIEPLKCVGVVWALFITRRNPAFPVHPLFIQSDPTLLQRVTHLKPSTERVAKKDVEFGQLSSASEFDRAIYQQYCKNKRRPGASRDRRRKIPALGESDVSIEDHAAPSGELEEAIFVPREVASKRYKFRYYADDGFRRTGVDLGVKQPAVGGFRRGGVDVGVGKVPKQGKNPEQGETPDGGDGSEVKVDETPVKTRIVWCNLVPEEERNK